MFMGFRNFITRVIDKVSVLLTAYTPQIRYLFITVHTKSHEPPGGFRVRVVAGKSLRLLMRFFDPVRSRKHHVDHLSGGKLQAGSIRGSCRVCRLSFFA